MRIFPGPDDPVNFTPYWVEVDTDPNGYNDAVYLTTLIQCLLLNLNESPFYGNYGIPAQQSVITQVFPDYYVWQTQQQFSSYFNSLIISPIPGATVNGILTPVYQVSVVTHQGATIEATIGR